MDKNGPYDAGKSVVAAHARLFSHAVTLQPVTESFNRERYRIYLSISLSIYTYI